MQQIGELTLMATDRFRPELVRSVREGIWKGATASPRRKIYISRAGALRRLLLNEEEIWPMFQAHGFERVQMEELSFEAQVELMMDTRVLAAPHGAGLTNMIFCAEGTHVVEIADPGFPNPNFYALASALGHPFWLVAAESEGAGHPLTQDLRVDPARIERLLAGLAECAL